MCRSCHRAGRRPGQSNDAAPAWRLGTLGIIALVLANALVGCTGGSVSTISPSVSGNVPTSPSISAVSTETGTIPFVILPALLPADATVIQEALQAGDADKLASVMTLPSGQAIDESVASGIAAAGLVVDVATFSQISGDSATVVARSDDGTMWLVFLIWSDDRWLITSTQVSGTPLTSTEGPTP